MGELGNATYEPQWPDAVLNGSNLSTTIDWDSPAGDHNTSGVGSSPVDPRHGIIVKYITVISYLLACVIGLAGNSLVIAILLRYGDARRKSVANYYILNLAAADELYMLMLPFFCYATATQSWMFGGNAGDITCKAGFILREANKFTSVATLVALTVDRTLAGYNLTRFRELVVGKVFCVLAWLVGLMSTLPYLWFAYVQEYDDRWSCQLRRIPLRYKSAWTIYQITAGLALPFGIILVAYLLLYWKVKRSKNKFRRRSANRSTIVTNGTDGTSKNSATTTLISVPDSSSNAANSNKTKTVINNSSSRSQQSQTKMAKIITVILFIFAGCHVPYYGVEIWALNIEQHYIKHETRPSASHTVAFMYINVFAQVLMFVSSCANPILYGAMNKNYADLYKRTLSCCFRNRGHSRPGRHTSSTAVPL